MRLLFKIVLGQMRAKKLQTVHMLLSMILSAALVTLVFVAFDTVKTAFALAEYEAGYWRFVYVGRVFIGLVGILCGVTVATAFSVEAEERIKILGFLSSVGMKRRLSYLYFMIEMGLYILPAVPAGIALGVPAAKAAIKHCIGAMARAAGEDPALVGELFPLRLFPATVAAIAAVTLAAALIAALITAFRLRRASLLLVIKRNSRIGVSLKRTLLSRLSEKLFGRIGALAGQNYDNYKWQYRFISLALSGGTIFFMTIYSLFHYEKVIRFIMKWTSLDNAMLYAVQYPVYALCCLFVFVYLFCALGFLRRSVDVRRRDLVAYVSVGISRADMVRMNVIEGAFLSWHALLYGLAGALIANYALLCALRAVYLEEVYWIPFSFPIGGMGYFVVLDLAVGVLYAVYSAYRLSKMDILDTIRQV